MTAKKRAATRRKKSAWSQARYHMKPSRVFWRLASGGKHNSAKGVRKAVVRSVVNSTKTREVSRQTPEAYEKLMGQRARRPAAKTTTKKTTARKPSVYEQAKQIPAQNRTTAARTAKKTAAPTKSQPIRKKDGTFDGRTPGSAVHHTQLGQAPPPDLRTRRLFDR